MPIILKAILVFIAILAACGLILLVFQPFIQLHKKTVIKLLAVMSIGGALSVVLIELGIF